ncbi:flagellar basal body L-ring protein FlgH [Endozoicomonas ascidiicola]|uniref:flagellar basal body L-ring protein FlgH n=1 Tax=Endozoicomonas ascidiicola TaxID=1698521 RepID=UPI000834CCEE|nr:flagellar basal body L-ring protein FlgH [Endozoicomonas ascidiicola]
MRIFLLGISLILAGCQNLPDTASVSPVFQEEPEVIPEPKVQQPYIVKYVPNGSLFNPRYGNMMVSDRRAYRLGDILTIELKGTTNISMGGGSSVNKSANIDIPDPTLLGRSSASILGSGRSLATSIQPTREYGGATSASRNNSLEGSVAVKVVEVLPNGTLRIQGNKWLTINSGREQIKISGLVRPEDVSTDNKVSSERLAEARVDYVALGDNANAHKPGWFARMLNSPWFPF